MIFYNDFMYDISLSVPTCDNVTRDGFTVYNQNVNKNYAKSVFFLPSFLVLAQWYIRGGQLVFWSKKDFPVKICPEIFRLCGIISIASWVMGNPADHLNSVVAQHRKWWYAKLPRPETVTYELRFWHYEVTFSISGPDLSSISMGGWWSVPCRYWDGKTLPGSVSSWADFGRHDQTLWSSRLACAVEGLKPCP